MRFLKSNKNYKFNLKYVLGEIFLLFIGISLAIWFNNWNTTKRSNKDKEIAIVKITEEISNNLVEIQIAQDSNQKIQKHLQNLKSYSTEILQMSSPLRANLIAYRKSILGFLD